MKKILIILISFLAINCTNKNQNQNQNEVITNQEFEIKTDKKLLFKSENLNDSLQTFVSSLDSIPNPYWR